MESLPIKWPSVLRENTKVWVNVRLHEEEELSLAARHVPETVPVGDVEGHQAVFNTHESRGLELQALVNAVGTVDKTL